MVKDFVHPYMPNSVPEIKEAMLRELGLKGVEEIYRSVIPEELLYKKRLDLPEPILSEYELKKHVEKIMGANVTTEEFTSFLGAGCYKHQVPAICDELNGRGEFLTAYCGDTYSDHGKMQAIFEYTSMMGELLDTDVVCYANYDAGQAAASSLSSAVRVQNARGRSCNAVLVPATMNPEILSQVREYLRHQVQTVSVAYDERTGTMDLEDLRRKLSEYRVGAVFYENPSYLGFYESRAVEIAVLAHEYGALVVARAEAASLGIVESPINLGADIVCGDIQPLGMHIQFGGGQGGFIGCMHDLELLEQLPTYMYGIARTENTGEFGWGRAMNMRCSHNSRENAREYFGTEAGLWAITAGIYLASMGPEGMYELGETIIRNCAYLRELLGSIPGVRIQFTGSCFQEIAVNFDGTGKTVGEINKALLAYRIFGGKDLSGDFPQFGQSALFCVSELTSAEDMHRLENALREILAGGGNGIL